MAFCKFCGKALQEGEVCNCQASQAANAGAPAPAPAPAPTPVQPAAAPAPGTTTVTVTLPSKDAVNAAAKNIFSTILNVLTHPASGGRTYVQNANKLVAIGIMGVHAIVSAIFSVIMVLQVNFQLEIPDSYKLSGIKAFFVTILFSVIFSALLTALVLAAAKILKLTASVDQVLSIASVRSIISIPLSLLACIFILINTGWGLFLFYGSILLTTIFLLEAIRGLGNVPEDKVVYAVSGVVVVFVILFALIGTKLAFGMYLSGELSSQFNSALRYLM